MGGTDDEKDPYNSSTVSEPQPVALSARRKEEGHNADAFSIQSLHSLAQSAHSTLDDDRSHDVEAALERTLTPKNPIVKVPLSERRGLFARFCLVAEVTEPYDYKNSTKWSITFMVAVAGAAAPVGSAIIFRTHVCNPEKSQVSNNCSNP